MTDETRKQEQEARQAEGKRQKEGLQEWLDKVVEKKSGQ